MTIPTTLSKSIDFFPFPKKPQEISPSRIILRRSGTKKQARDLSPDLPRARVEVEEGGGEKKGHIRVEEGCDNGKCGGDGK